MPQARTPASKPPATPPLVAGGVVVHPALGACTVVGQERQTVAGYDLETMVLSPMTGQAGKISIPLPKVPTIGLRAVSTPAEIDSALAITGDRPKTPKVVWSKRSKDIEDRIATGVLVTLAEVMRDMYRPDGDPEPSYSQRQLYESARDKVAGEIVVARNVTMFEALQAIAKAAYVPKGGQRPQPAEEGDEDAEAA